MLFLIHFYFLEKKERLRLMTGFGLLSTPFEALQH